MNHFNGQTITLSQGTLSVPDVTLNLITALDTLGSSDNHEKYYKQYVQLSERGMPEGDVLSLLSNVWSALVIFASKHGYNSPVVKGDTITIQPFAPV